MLKKIIVLFGLALLLGCSHHTQNTVGGMHSNLATGLTVYHQYNLTTASFTKQKRLVHHTGRFKADLNADLPSNTESLDLALAIVNPHKLQFEIWERVNYIEIETKKVFYRAERKHYNTKEHPKEHELISIKLPVVSKQHCEVLYHVFVKDPTGENVHYTYTARYKIGKEN